jgi:hypothetical protein
MKPSIVKVLYKHYRMGEYEYDELAWLRDTNRKPQSGELKRYEKRFTWFDPPSNKGGMTECVLVLDNNETIVGVSTCSLADNFSYRIGRELAYERAVDAYNKAYGE